MLDTLKLARELNSAGLEQSVADALAANLNQALRDAEPVTEPALKRALDTQFWRLIAAVAVMLSGHFLAMRWVS